jgi:hypothetical protein
MARSDHTFLKAFQVGGLTLAWGVVHHGQKAKTGMVPIGLHQIGEFGIGDLSTQVQQMVDPKHALACRIVHTADHWR